MPEGLKGGKIMRTIKFHFAGFETIREYEDSVPDEEIEKDFQVWKKDIIKKNFESYWIDSL